MPAPRRSAGPPSFWWFGSRAPALFAGAPPYPFHAQVREATASTFYKAITGDLSASDALDQMAETTEAELKKLGYRK